MFVIKELGAEASYEAQMQLIDEIVDISTDQIISFQMKSLREKANARQI